jgi:23S rRNA pseudouridine1911/1915/1917 synthase
MGQDSRDAVNSLELQISDADVGKRIDLYLLSQSDQFASRAHLQKLIKSGRVQVDGKPCKSHHRVRLGERIRVQIPPPEPMTLEPQNIPIKIVHDDADLVVVDKPAGLVTHPGAGCKDGTLVNALLWHVKTLSPSEDAFRPGIVHRLDKESSGLLVVAKTPHAHARLAIQFKNRTIDRMYRAFVKGCVEFDEGTIEEPIGRHPRQRKKMAVVSVGGKRALTLYKVLRRYQGVTDLEVKIKTGRTHQIRVHLAYIGYPVISDPEYGQSNPGIARTALHAAVLGFKHPTTEKRLRFESPLPEDMKTFLTHLSPGIG